MIPPIAGYPLVELCELAGIKLTQVYAMHVGVQEVTFFYYLHNDAGHPYLIPGTQEVAASSLTRRIDWQATR